MCTSADIVEAHEKAMNHDGSFVVNIGTGEGISVNEIFRHLQEVTGYNEPAIYGPPRPGMSDILHLTLRGQGGCWAGSRRLD